jgi:2-dehydro-3-deoxyphosphogluconate aldolase/(4S)-4-hydroxy-2-oxoglutarate aldolase
MTKLEVRARIEEFGIIPAVRVSNAADVMFAAETITSAGIPILEITMTVPDAVHVIHDLTRSQPDIVVGAGSILDAKTANLCIEAGASFITSTGFDADVVKAAQEKDVLIFPGVLTPTEIIAALKAGSDIVKIFPCSQVGGPSYIRALKRPFPQVPMIASGGVDQQTVADFILAGAVAVGIGHELIPLPAIRKRQRDWIEELARRFLNLVKQARAQIHTNRVARVVR